MEIYKKASKMGLRIPTAQGPLSVEKLWTLSLPQLDKLAVQLKKDLKETEEESFLATRSAADTLAQLKFDIVLDVLTSKLRDQEIAAKAQETKAHNKKIDELIARKQDEKLESLPVEELEKLRK